MICWGRRDDAGDVPEKVRDNRAEKVKDLELPPERFDAIWKELTGNRFAAHY